MNSRNSWRSNKIDQLNANNNFTFQYLLRLEQLILLVKQEKDQKIVETLVVIGLILGVIAMIGFFFIEPDFYRGEGRLTIGSMVGEESVGNHSLEQNTTH